jgi:putative Mg2+ transporter-C (MgtC) family protein
VVDELTMCLRVLGAAVIGLAIGFEREMVRKPAGLRTHVLVAVASAVLVTSALALAARLGAPGDALRVPAGIVTGIGFIGAGTVIQTRGHVSGLTTAATIFMAAALGVAIGGGLYGIAATGTVLTVVVTWGMRRFEEHLEQRVPADQPRPRRIERPAAPRKQPGD